MKLVDNAAALILIILYGGLALSVLITAFKQALKPKKPKW